MRNMILALIGIRCFYRTANLLPYTYSFFDQNLRSVVFLARPVRDHVEPGPTSAPSEPDLLRIGERNAFGVGNAAWMSVIHFTQGSNQAKASAHFVTENLISTLAIASTIYASQFPLGIAGIEN